MPAADHASDTRLDPKALDLELSLLLNSAAPSGWRSAVVKAAHLLCERYRGDWAELHTLALLLFARTHAGDRPPRDVSVEELVRALDGPTAEENRVTKEIRQALPAAGQKFELGERHEEPQLLQVFRSVSDRYGGPLPWCDEWDPVPPRPSPLDHAAKRLVIYLSTYQPGHRNGPSHVPEVGDGPLHVEADRLVMASRHSLVPRPAPEAAPPFRAVSPSTARTSPSSARAATRAGGHSSSIPRR
ncbi:hypothetical protein [Streptomyces niveus]|uniref:hypothetical protein n=1 Tax=Streptomyces niveus TaxID=193462 RepID=UPI0036E287F5